MWIRLRIDPAADKHGRDSNDPTERVVLRIRPALLNSSVELFDLLELAGSTSKISLSTRQSLNERRTLNLNFLIPRGSGPRDIWLRIDSSITRVLHLEVLNQTDARAKDTQQGMWYGIYLGLVVMFLGVALVNWFISRELLLLAFAIKQLFALVFSLFAMGYSRMLLEGFVSPHVFLYLHALSIVALFYTAFYYEYRFLCEIDPPHWIHALIKASLWTGPLIIALILAGEIRWALFLQLHLVMLMPFLGFATVLLARYPDLSPTNHPVLPRKILLPVYAGILGSVLFAVMPILGYRQATELALHPSFFHSVITGALMIGLLQVRANHITRVRLNALTELAIAKAQAQQDQIQRDEREKMLSMLTHELKTPLASIRMLLGLRESPATALDEIKRAVIDLNEIVDRCVQAGRLNDLNLHVDSQAVDLVQEMHHMKRRLSGHDFIKLHAPDTCWVTTDVQILRMLLSNLMGNAVKYRRDETDVHCRLIIDEANASRVCLQIDNLEGQTGRPDPRLVFSKYYRNPNARRKTGSGLGLFLVSELVEQIGATVRYVDNEQVVRFELCLPR